MYIVVYLPGEKCFNPIGDHIYIKEFRCNRKTRFRRYTNLVGVVEDFQKHTYYIMYILYTVYIVFIYLLLRSTQYVSYNIVEYTWHHTYNESKSFTSEKKNKVTLIFVSSKLIMRSIYL